MTITIQGAPAEEEEESFFLEFSLPLMCEAEYSNGYTCDNEADYTVETSCCAMRVNLCEECLFEFVEYAQKYEGTAYECAVCDKVIILSVNHLIVVGRL